MPDEIGSGGEQVVATPAIKESLDAVQQAAFDECMRNRANQIPDELPVTAEAECLRFASQVDLTQETSGGDASLKDQVVEDYSQYMQKCQQEFGKSAEECEKLWQTYAGQISTAKVMGGDTEDVDKPFVGVSHDQKASWVAHKDRPYTKKPK